MPRRANEARRHGRLAVDVCLERKHLLAGRWIVVLPARAEFKSVCDKREEDTEDEAYEVGGKIQVGPWDLF